MAGVPVDVNTADRKQLCKLGGIGGGTADKIIAGRPFASWEDLATRVGISQKNLQKIQETDAAFTGVLVFDSDSQRGMVDLISEEDSDDEYLESVDSDMEGIEESADGGPSESQQIAPKLLQRWEKKKLHFRQLLEQGSFTAEEYYDAARDGADAIAYYATIGTTPTYAQLSQLLQTRRFGGRSKVMFPLIDRHPDGTLKCIYSARELSDSEGNLVLKCDEEHCVPQSWQATKTAHTGRDVHQMFAAWKSANGHRGNRPFGVGSVLKGENEFGQLFAIEGRNQTLFVPNINQGAVARATLYILVAYPGALDRARVPDASVSWCVQACLENPPTVWEKHRNATGYAHQHNRNPFIDHPEWASHIDFSNGFASFSRGARSA